MLLEHHKAIRRVITKKLGVEDEHAARTRELLPEQLGATATREADSIVAGGRKLATAGRIANGVHGVLQGFGRRSGRSRGPSKELFA